MEKQTISDTVSLYRIASCTDTSRQSHRSHKTTFVLCVQDDEDIVAEGLALLTTLSNKLNIATLLICFKALPDKTQFANEIQHLTDYSSAAASQQPHLSGHLVLAGHSLLCNVIYAALADHQLPALQALVLLAPLFNKNAITRFQQAWNNPIDGMENSSLEPLAFTASTFQQLSVNYSAWLGDAEEYIDPHQLISFLTQHTAPTIDQVIGKIAEANHKTVISHAANDVTHWLADVVQVTPADAPKTSTASLTYS